MWGKEVDDSWLFGTHHTHNIFIQIKRTWKFMISKNSQQCEKKDVLNDYVIYQVALY